jgi:hypothetical protein
VLFCKMISPYRYILSRLSTHCFEPGFKSKKKVLNKQIRSLVTFDSSWTFCHINRAVSNKLHKSTNKKKKLSRGEFSRNKSKACCTTFFFLEQWSCPKSVHLAEKILKCTSEFLQAQTKNSFQAPHRQHFKKDR